MICPICKREIKHHVEYWCNEKIEVWTFICDDCLKEEVKGSEGKLKNLIA